MAASTPSGGPLADSSSPPVEGVEPLVPIAIDAQREQDRLLPEANIVRIMKRALPDGTKVSKEAKAAVVEAASEFVAFVTQEGEPRAMRVAAKRSSTMPAVACARIATPAPDSPDLVPNPEWLPGSCAANDRCRMDGRKTLTAEDLLAAMRTLGLDQYHDVLLDYLIRHREVSLPSAAQVAGLLACPPLQQGATTPPCHPPPARANCSPAALIVVRCSRSPPPCAGTQERAGRQAQEGRLNWGAPLRRDHAFACWTGIADLLQLEAVPMAARLPPGSPDTHAVGASVSSHKTQTNATGAHVRGRGPRIRAARSQRTRASRP